MAEDIDWYTATPEQIDAEAKRRKFIPADVFEIVLDWANIPTADFIVTREREGKKQFLLALRTEGAWQGEWFVPGGRIPPMMMPGDAAKANCKRELGFVPKTVHFVGFLTVLNPVGTNRPAPWISLWNLLTIPIGEDVEIKLNSENKEFKWFDRIGPSFPEPVKQALRMAGFNE